MKRILLAVLIVALCVGMAAYADVAWFGYESAHIENLLPRINGSGTIQRWYRLLPANHTYDTSAATHEYADLAETSIIPKGGTTSKWYDLYDKKCTQFKIEALGTDITSDAGGVNFFLLGSEDGKNVFIVDVDSGIAEGSWYSKDFTADSSGFPRYLMLAAMEIDTHTAATVVRNQFDVSVKFFGPEGNLKGK